MKRTVEVSSLFALSGWLVCLVLASGTGCSIYFGEPDTGVPNTDAPDTDMPDTGNGDDNDNDKPDQPDPGNPGGDGSSELPSGPIWGTADGGNADGIHGCGNGGMYYHHYEHASSLATQLHVVSIYRPAPGDDGSDEPVHVHINRAGKSVLVLSAYDAAVWNVTTAPGVVLERVILNGFDAQEAIVPDGVAVDVYGPAGGTDYLGEIGYEWPSYRTDTTIKRIQSLTGLELTSFRGCNQSSEFQIDEPDEVRPPHPVSESTEPGIIAGCEHLAEESNYCLAMEGFQWKMFMLGLDSGKVCYGAESYVNYITDSTLGWVGDYMYACAHERGLVRISIIDGTVDIAPVPCNMVTSHRGGLLALMHDPNDEDGFDPSYLARYDSFAAVVENRPERVFAIDPFASRMATNGDQVYFAWHSTDSIETTVLADDATLTSILLENYDTWVFGLEVTDDGQMIVGSPDWNGGLHIFDAETGAFQKVLRSQVGTINTNGIECVSGGGKK